LLRDPTHNLEAQTYLPSPVEIEREFWNEFKSIYKVVVNLPVNISKAASELDEESFASLKKMEALAEGFQDACHILTYDYSPLVNANSDTWW
jgi:hypothetical protein